MDVLVTLLRADRSQKLGIETKLLTPLSVLK